MFDSGSRRKTGGVQAIERHGSVYYLHGDGLSSTQLNTGSSGNPAARILYDAWGNEISPATWGGQSYATQLEMEGFATRFVGGLGVGKGGTTGLIYMRHRWYDAQRGRFLSRDPIGHAEAESLKLLYKPSE